MVDIETTSYGLKITLSNPVDEDDAQRGIEELQAVLPDLPSPFGVLIDSRELGLPEEEARLVFVKAGNLLNRHGMEKIAVAPAPRRRDRAFRTLRQSGLLPRALVLNVDEDSDWERTAEEWLAG